MAGPCSPTRVVLLCCWLAGSVNASALPPQLKDTNAQPSAAGSHGVRRLAPCSDVEAVSIDFASTTNPAVAMQWTDANGQVYNGSPANGIVGIVPFQTTDTTGGAFPGGSVRWSNLGSDNGVAFDLLVTVPAQPSTYANTVSVTYSSPQSSFSSQAILTAQGYACLGFSLSPSTCLTGAAVDQVTASCADGTPTTLSASEFDFTFVRSGTTTQMPTFAQSFLTFVDVDGDAQTGGNLYELVSVLSAGVLSTTTAASSPLQTGQFSPSGARFAIATQPINVPTDFTVSSATPSAVSLPAIVAFDLRAVSAMKVLLGGRSSVPVQAERGYCFTMTWPDGLPSCTVSPPPAPPLAPVVEAVSIDFASTTNPAVAMQWTDANGQVYNGSPANGIVGIVPFQTTDTTGGAFPGGSVRWSNLGSDNGVAFDLLVTVPAQPSTYANTVSVTYSSPQSSFSSQAILTAQGYACLGFSLSPSTCLTGAAVDQVTASCADGTPTTLSASEFDFTFVRSGTTTQMPTFAQSFLTFVDVDGDAQTGGNLYELVSVLSAGVLSTTTAASSPLQTGQFSPSGARFAIATQPINVPTDFTVSSATPSAVSLPAIVAFDLRAVSAMKVLLGGRSSVPGQAERGYCFTMAWPAGIDGAQAQPTAPCDVCTDPRETYMIDNGLYCDTWTWAHTNRCNSYQPWRDDPVPQKTCRLSCFLNGNGYDGVSTLWDSHDGTSNCHCLVHRHIQLPLFGTHPSLTAGSHPHLSIGQLLRPGVSAFRSTACGCEPSGPRGGVVRRVHRPS